MRYQIVFRDRDGNATVVVHGSKRHCEELAPTIELGESATLIRRKDRAVLARFHRDREGFQVIEY